MARFLPTFRLLSGARRCGVALLTVLGACTDAPSAPSNPSTETYASSLAITVSEYRTINTALLVKDVVVGTGTEATAGRRVRVHYSGWLPNGQRFDSSVGREPFETTIGVGQVIAGWDQGIPGMRVGGKRRLLIGSALGYGPQGSGPIPPNSTLVFEVELLAVP